MSETPSRSPRDRPAEPAAGSDTLRADGPLAARAPAADEVARLVEAGITFGGRLEHLQGTLDALRHGQEQVGAELRRTRRTVAAAALVVLAALSGAVVWAADRAARTEARLDADRATLAASLQEAREGERAAREDGRRRADEVDRLRGSLVDKERRLADLVTSFGDVAARVAPAASLAPAGAGGTGAPDGSALVRPVNAALEVSGADLRLLEAGALRDGALEEVLAVRGERGEQPLAIERLWTSAERGVLVVHLRWASGGGMLDERLPLPEARRAPWEAAGLRLPPGWRPLADVREALSAALAGTGHALVRLAGHGDGVLLDVELVERDGDGSDVRRLRAARARLDPAVPALVLEDGAVEQAGEQRPFWRGSLHLPLAGVDPAPLAEALGS